MPRPGSWQRIEHKKEGTEVAIAEGPQLGYLRVCLIYGASKGIRILIVLVTIGDYWDSLVQRSCGESQ